MKLSVFSDFVSLNGKDFLFNTRNDAIIALDKELKERIEACADKIEKLYALNSELYHALDKCGFVVNDQEDEYEQVRSRIVELSEDMTSYHLTINPTMNCNFHCWYCYEDHMKGTKMNPQNVSSVCTLITSIFEKTDTKKLILSFFGGEPLMYWKEVIVPILDWAESEAKRMKKELNIYATTNGYYLTNDIVKRLAQCSFASVQIPFDGSRETYNSVKFTRKKESSYDKVLTNVIHAANNGIDVTVRCNYTSDNLESFAMLADDLDCIKSNPNIRFDFHKIWQENMTLDLETRFENLYDELIRKGFSLESRVNKRATCYADKRANAVINYNGDVYKCTARRFDREARLGILRKDGTIGWNSVAKDREKCKYHSKACSSCILFPICLQSCSQVVFESFSEDICAMNYSSEDIKQEITKRVQAIMKEKRTQI